jgi:hypothetical protein
VQESLSISAGVMSPSALTTAGVMLVGGAHHDANAGRHELDDIRAGLRRANLHGVALATVSTSTGCSLPNTAATACRVPK